jgi:hypothetical protein
MISLHAGSAVTAAFLGSLVEAVEALTIVLAVAVVRGWRAAGFGAISPAASLALRFRKLFIRWRSRAPIANHPHQPPLGLFFLAIVGAPATTGAP